MAGKGYVEIDGAVKVIGKYYVEVDGLSKKVEKIYVKDAQGKSRLAYVAHVHSWTVTRTYLDDTYHTKANACACGVREEIAEAHEWKTVMNGEYLWHSAGANGDYQKKKCVGIDGKSGCAYIKNGSVSSHGNWSRTYTTSSPTCTSSGAGYKVCGYCGYNKTEQIAALGHDYKVKSRVPSTCTVKGSVTYACSRCGDSYTETLAYAAHKMGSDGKCLFCGFGFEIME